MKYLVLLVLALLGTRALDLSDTAVYDSLDSVAGDWANAGCDLWGSVSVVTLYFAKVTSIDVYEGETCDDYDGTLTVDLTFFSDETCNVAGAVGAMSFTADITSASLSDFQLQLDYEITQAIMTFTDTSTMAAVWPSAANCFGSMTDGVPSDVTAGCEGLFLGTSECPTRYGGLDNFGDAIAVAPIFTLDPTDGCSTGTRTTSYLESEGDYYAFQFTSGVDGVEENESCVVEGTGDEGTGDEGTAEEGSGDEGTAEEGTGDEGTAEEGSGDEGTAEEGTGDEGTAEEGSADEGTAEEGSADEGSADEGSADEGTSEEGSGDEGTAEEGSGDDEEDLVDDLDSASAKLASLVVLLLAVLSIIF